MELRKFFYKSYHSKPKTKLKKILDDNIFFKSSLLLKMALNKNIKINTNYKIDRLKTDKNLTTSLKQDDSEEDIENKRYEKMIRKKNLLSELEDIIEDNAKKTEKFIESFKGLKEENNKFINGYEDIKIPVEKRIKSFIINTIQLFRENNIEINFRSRTKENKKTTILENEIDDLNDLWEQNKAAVKLFRQCPLILNSEKNIYFYYLANFLGEKLNVKEHKYIKYMNLLKDFLNDMKNEKNYGILSSKKEEEIINDKLSKQKNKEKTKSKNEDINKEILKKNVKMFTLNKTESAKIILDTHHKPKLNKINIKSINVNQKENNNSNNNSKNKQSSRKNINSKQEGNSKEVINSLEIENYENKIDFRKNSDKNKIIDLSCITTPNNQHLNHKRNNLKIKKHIYLKTFDNKTSKNIKIMKIGEELNKCNSTKNYTLKFNKNSLIDTNYTFNNKMSSKNISNIKHNFLSMKKNTSSKLNNFENLLSRNNYNKMRTMNLYRYIKELKINDKMNDKNPLENSKTSKKIVNLKNSNFETIKLTGEKEISPIKIKTKKNNLIELYEKAKKTNLSTIKNMDEINDYLKSKGIKNDDILNGIQYNSDIAFINLREKANKLNIEARTKTFFYGIIPNHRKKKLEQLKEINSKITQIEKEYIKTLIDKDLTFKK